jgi:2,3-diketo-5-methylthiopentyl-1-phosphate enolase
LILCSACYRIRKNNHVAAFKPSFIWVILNMSAHVLLPYPLLQSQLDEPALRRVQHVEQRLICFYQWRVEASSHLNALQQLGVKLANGQTIGTQNSKQVEALADVAARLEQAALSDVMQDLEGAYRLGLLAISYPSAVVACDLGALLTVVFGKVSMAGAVRLVDLWLPSGLSQRYKGPALGMAGLRQRAGVGDQSPLLMSIFKPCLGLSPAILADKLYTLSRAGCHLVKDDEVLSDTSLDTALARLEACLSAAEKARAGGGQAIQYVMQLSGPVHELFQRAETLAQNGAKAFLFNYWAYGLPVMQSLRECLPQDVALFAHPAFSGGFYGSPWHGLSPACAFGVLPRLAGADAVLFPSPYGSVCLPKADTLAIQQALSREETGLKASFGVPSAGIQASMLPELWQDFGHDVIVNAGTGIWEATGGPEVATRSFLEQWPNASLAVTRV